MYKNKPNKNAKNKIVKINDVYKNTNVIWSQYNRK